MSGTVVVVGAGGFGREVIDVLWAMNDSSGSKSLEVIGVLDDNPSDRDRALLESRRCAYLGKIDDWLQGQVSAQYIIGIGSPLIRQAIARRFEAVGARAAIAVHPTASFGYDVRLGRGTVICAGVRLMDDIRIGHHVHINLNATIGHDVIIEDYVSINPLAAVSGDCTIRELVLVGTGSVILQGLEVGPKSVVGASACVVRNVPSGTTVKGVPAR